MRNTGGMLCESKIDSSNENYGNDDDSLLSTSPAPPPLSAEEIFYAMINGEPFTVQDDDEDEDEHEEDPSTTSLTDLDDTTTMTMSPVSGSPRSQYRRRFRPFGRREWPRPLLG